MKPSFKKGIRWGGRLLFLGIGLFLLKVVFDHLQTEKLLEAFHHLGAKVIFVWMIPLLWLSAQTLAWHLTVEETGNHLSFARLFLIKIMGDAVNPMTPLGFIGGDPIRFSLLKKKMPGALSAASVVLDRTVQSLAIVVMLTLTLLVAPFRLNLPLSWKIAFPLMTAFMAFILWFSIHHQRKGIFVRFSHIAQKFGGSPQKIESLKEELHHIDQQLVQFYHHSPLRFLAVLFCHIIGRFGLVLEIYIIALLVGTPLAFDGALFMAMLAVLLNIFFAFVPGGMGILEGGYAALGTLLKIGSTAGVAIQLVRRLRAVFWIFLGALFMLAYSPGTIRALLNRNTR